MDEERPVADTARRDPAAETTAARGTPVAPTDHPRRTRPWGPILFGIFVILPILVIALWTTIALNWSYSEGDRAGYVQKLSRKGWFCKTWEGEIAMVNMPGQAQEKFAFSVRDDSVAREITRLMGNRVDITYAEHRAIPLRCFGETNYFVTGVRKAAP